MILMDTVALDRDVAVRRTATAEPRPADHALRWLCCPSPNSISGPSNWVITLSQEHGAIADAVRAVQPVDGAAPIGRGAGMSAPAKREIRREGGECAAKPLSGVLGALSVDGSLDRRLGSVGAGAGWHTDCGCVQLEWGDDFFDQHLLFSSGPGHGLGQGAHGLGAGCSGSG